MFHMYLHASFSILSYKNHCVVFMWKYFCYGKITLVFPSISGDLSSQLQAQEPGSSESMFTVLEDSGCDLSNEQRTEPSEMSQHLVESYALTPSPPLPIVKRHCAVPENPLSSHMQFLQHLLELKNWTESGSLKTDLSCFENSASTVSDSVFQLLDGLITFYHEPKLPFSKFCTEAVATLARLISDCNLSNHILKKCSKKLEEFEKTLLQIILRNNHINRVSNKSLPFMKYISHFGEHSHWIMSIALLLRVFSWTCCNSYPSSRPTPGLWWLQHLALHRNWCFKRVPFYLELPSLFFISTLGFFSSLVFVLPIFTSCCSKSLSIFQNTANIYGFPIYNLYKYLLSHDGFPILHWFFFFFFWHWIVGTWKPKNIFLFL